MERGANVEGEVQTSRDVSMDSSISTRPSRSHFRCVCYHTITLSHYHTITLSHHHTITLSHYHTITLSHYHTITLSHHHTITLSHYHTITLSHYHTITLSHYHTIALSPPPCFGEKQLGKSSQGFYYQVPGNLLIACYVLRGIPGTVLREAIVIRTHDGPKHPHISLFLHTIIGPDYNVPP